MVINMADNKITEMLETSLNGIRNLADTDTIIGKPIEAAGGVTVIPVSKVSFGYTGGGYDYVGKHPSPAGKNNFAGASGTGASVTPVGFLVISPDGRTEILNINNAGASTNGLDAVINKLPDIINKIKDTINKKKAEKEAVKAEKDAEKAEQEAEKATEEVKEDK